MNKNNEPLKLILEKINELIKTKTRIIVAIDGMSGSGKTTIAKMISKHLTATVIHMDDFFLRSQQRTKERLQTPGGNIDVERLLDEVVIPIFNGEQFTYKPFDCHTMTFKEEKLITPANIVILEGSYSCHPKLYSYCDLHIFLHIDRITQIKRILLRSGYDKTTEFINKWIPLENQYFRHFNISEKCELSFHM